MISRCLMLVYAVGAYLMALSSLVYIMGFLADFGVHKSISSGGPEQSPWLAGLIDVCLVGLFGLQHSLTARTSFKRWWTQLIPAPIERATYLYMTTAMTALLLLFWQPIAITLWEVRAPSVVIGIRVAYLGLWGVMTAATFQFGHLSFFGLAQVWAKLKHTPPTPSKLTARYLYALARHPISLCWMLAALVTPHLTVGHVVFAASTFVYVVLATPFEEADLVEALGAPYLEYRERTRTFVPLPK